MTHPAGQDAVVALKPLAIADGLRDLYGASGRLKRKTVGEVQAKSSHTMKRVRKLGCTPSLEAPEAPKKCTHGRSTVPVALSEGAFAAAPAHRFAFPASVDLERGATFETGAHERMVSA